MIDTQAFVGMQGPPGETGAPFHITAVVASQSALPALSTVGLNDVYLTADTRELWTPNTAKTSWVLLRYTLDVQFPIALAQGGTGVNNTNVLVNRVFAGPSSGTGAASFRRLVASDLPVVPINKGGTGIATSSTPNRVFATATSGVAATAPSFRALVAADIPDIPVTKITSGVLPIARGGTGIATSSTPNRVFATATSGTSATAPSFRALVAADIPGIPVDKITSGVLPINRGGTGNASISSTSGVTEVFSSQSSNVSSYGTPFRYKWGACNVVSVGSVTLASSLAANSSRQIGTLYGYVCGIVSYSSNYRVYANGSSIYVVNTGTSAISTIGFRALVLRT